MRWEYKTVVLDETNFTADGFIIDSTYFNSSVDSFMNEYGNKSWELVSAVGILLDEAKGFPHTKEIVLFFKRAIDE